MSINYNMVCDNVTLCVTHEYRGYKTPENLKSHFWYKYWKFRMFFRKKLTLHNQMILQKEIKTPIIVCDIYACPFFGARILKWCVLIMGWFYAFSFSKVTLEHKKSYILSPSLTIWLAKGIFWTSSKMSHTKKVWHFKRYCGCFPWSKLLVLLWYFFLAPHTK